MTAEFRRNRMRFSASRFIKRLSSYLLFGIIIALIPIFVVFLMRDSKPGQFTGVVESESETIGSVDDSRILSIEVVPGQQVKPGDILVRLVPTDRAVDLAMNEARLMDYQQSLTRYKENQLQYKQSLRESIRKYSQLVEEAAVQLEQEKMNKASAEAELEGLKQEINKLRPLVEKRIISEIELARLRPRVTMLEQTLPHYEPLISALQRRLDKAADGLEEVLTLHKNLERSKEDNPIELAFEKARQACDNLAEVELSVLRATRAGIVSRIQHQPGDVVAAGAPIIRITSKSSMYITGLLPQGTPAPVSVGDRIAVTPLNREPGAGILTAEVETIDPEVMDLIDPFNPSPRMPVRGRRMRLRVVDAEHNLVPGETVYLRATPRESLLQNIKRCFIPESGVQRQLLFTTSR